MCMQEYHDHRKLTMFSAEASAAKATTMATREALSLANRCTVACTHASSLEPITLRLTGPGLSNHWPHHPCKSFQTYTLINPNS